MSSPEKSTAARLDALALGIAEALDAEFDPKRGFSGTEFYATAFACLLWKRWPERFGGKLEAGLVRLREQDKRALIGDWRNRYHWEFVRFALADLFRNAPVCGYANARALLGPLRFAGTRVANWTLLRSTVRIAEGGLLGRWIGRIERRVALTVFQQPGGFIEDRRGAPTQQYHAFMTALLGYQIQVLGERSNFLADGFERALAALVRTALPDGEVNAAGRGAFQSFGYAAACLALAEGLHIGLAPQGAAALLAQTLTRLERATANDGALPLLLTRTDEQVTVAPPSPHPHQQRIGWHSYNNGADYLAFSGAVLALAADQLRDLEEVPNPAPLPPVDQLMDGIRSVRTSHYGAIATLPHADIAPAQPLPYLVTARGARPLPAYGGEKLPDSIYTPFAMPLPVFEKEDGNFTNLLETASYRWAGADKIVGESGAWRFERRFGFRKNDIEIVDALILADISGIARIHLPWLPFPESATSEDGKRWQLDGAILESDLPLSEVPSAGPQYGLSGRLRICSHAAPPPTPGEVLEAGYRITLPA